VSGPCETNSRKGLNNKVTEACARKITQPEGKDWGSTWTLTQESHCDEAETVCHNCYVGGFAPQIQKDAFHNLLSGVVHHWMRENYFGDYTVDRKQGPNPSDKDGFKHSQQPLTDAVMQKCSMETPKLRL